MGGMYETLMGNLRYHLNKSKVHIHDDSAGIKFTLNASKFRKEVDSFFKLQKEYNEVVLKIEGDTSVQLVLCKIDRNFGAILMGNKKIKSSLRTFIKRLQSNGK